MNHLIKFVTIMARLMGFLMEKLKRYECCGDRDGIAWLMIDGHQENEMDYCYMNSDVEALESENERLKAEIEKLKRIEQKAFWWSAEFTEFCHDRKIQSAWEDWRENFRNFVQ